MFWISKFKDGDIDDLEYRKAIIDIFVNAIFLYDNKLVITFNWKDGTKTVSLEELESAGEADVSQYSNCAGSACTFTMYSPERLAKPKERLKTRRSLGSHLDDDAPPQKPATAMGLLASY